MCIKKYLKIKDLYQLHASMISGIIGITIQNSNYLRRSLAMIERRRYSRLTHPHLHQRQKEGKHDRE